ncbi:response regulator [Methylopila henanensis]|uniref:histidine kinase n=1 Tax=Methylopila henanensis TaxID=873516 RepID=A0ABW4K502_9HYPH
MTATASLFDDRDAPDPARRIAVAAHEIRTPLGGILALAELLLAEELSETARGHASALKASAEHLLGVASTLLGVAERAPTVGELDVDAFLARVAPPIAARAALQRVGFRVTRGAGVPDHVLADEGALRQIVDNLADNALRATERGAIELALERVEGDTASVTLRLSVRDTGRGLGDEPQRLFEPFVQGPESRGAAGLGLALVAELAASMDGQAEAANRPAGGAEVGVVLRLGAARPAPAGPSPHVLVAEDNAINRRVIGTLLDHFGLSYDMVTDGEAAVTAVARGGYDLVLMDATMPRLDGLAATRAIRALPAPASGIRIVGVTARAFDDEIAAFERAGVDAVVVKPLSVAELWGAIAPAAPRAKAG